MCFHVQISLVNPKPCVVFWCRQDQKGTVWTEIFFNGWRSKGTLVRFEVYSSCGVLTLVDYCFLAKGNQPRFGRDQYFSLGRTFYRLRLVRNLNDKEFISCSGKVVGIYL